MKIVFLVFVLLLQGCASRAKKGCEYKIQELYRKAAESEDLFVVSSMEARSPDGARGLLRDKVPAFHPGGSRLKIKRHRSHDSRNRYYEKNDSGFWTLSDGARREPDIVCKKKSGDYYAYALVNTKEIKNFLLNR